MARRGSTAQTHRRTERWREQFNPLRGLTLHRAIAMLEAYRRGEMADLQWLYSHIEESDSTLLALVERRTGALSELDWDIRIIEDDDLPKNATRKQAEEQRDYLQEIYGQIDNLTEAIEFLALATFRGFAHLQKHRDENGVVRHLEPLDQWNWVRDGMYGDWLWNPKAMNVTADSVRKNPDAQIVREDFVIREVARHLDRLALIKYVRTALGEKDWTAFVEIYGIPGAIVIMPPLAPNSESEKQNYLTLGQDVAAGGTGVLPNGASAVMNDGPRGVNPFRDFIRYLDEKLILAGTGGLLTMLAESGSGTLAGNAHQKTFEAIARAEGRKVSEVFRRQLDRELIHAEFGEDAPILAYFDLNRSDLSEEEIKFQRDVWLGFQRDGTVSDIMANLTNLRKLTADVGLPFQEDYEEPWLEVRSDGGGIVTGEVRRDAEGDIVGGISEAAQPSAAGPGGPGAMPGVPGGADPRRAMLNRRIPLSALRQAFAAGVSEDMKKVAARLQAIEKITNREEQNAALEQFLKDLPQLEAEINALPKSADAIVDALAEGLKAGFTIRRGERK